MVRYPAQGPFKLIESAQRRWRMVNAPHMVALLDAGAAFVNGKFIERPEDEAGQGRSAGSSLKDLDPQVLTITLPRTDQLRELHQGRSRRSYIPAATAGRR